MLETYKTVYKGGQGEIVEKNPVLLLPSVRWKRKKKQLLLEEMRKTYWNATHNCYAYTVGKNREFTRCSDDGEPSQTAGRPMLDVLLGKSCTTRQWWLPGISGEPFWVPGDWYGPIPGQYRKV